MAEITYSPDAVKDLKGKVAVITGGAQGIGAATVELFYEQGAHVFFADWDATKGQELEATLRHRPSPNQGTATFRQVDVRNYQSQVDLVESAYQQHGRLDFAVSCAAVKEPDGWFEPADLNLETVRQEPTPLKDSIEISLTSVVAFCRVVLAYMAASPGDSPKSITLVSSIAGITESPGLFAYGAAKHGVIGMMRALRRWAPVKYGVRANAICPWATDTQMLGVKDMWVREKMPINTPRDVAQMIAQCAVDQSLNGRAVFVSGGRGFDTEEGVDRTLPQWMGEKNAEQFLKGQELLGLGDGWTKPEL
ncbi:hypothetical protein F4780DRAFT_744510 [Xylariomycetidae sp. FL0641]|nr:hypothetical protein F4780DRAFT_744510 [Xylariomycetidae sp. FL0641]